VLLVPGLALLLSVRVDAEDPSVSPIATAPVQATLPHASERRVSGAAFVGYRGFDGQTTGAILTVSPGWDLFVRGGGEATPSSPRSEARFLWEVGFESPRDGTFFANVHDWGPAHVGAVTQSSAELSAGYKIPRACAGPLCLATSAFAALPLAGGPYVGGSGALILARAWFASAALGRSVPGALARGDDPRWRIFYSVGRWDGQPGTFFVTYHDEVRLASLRGAQTAYRQGNGVLAAGMSWAL